MSTDGIHTNHIIVVPDFFDHAEEMRSVYDTCLQSVRTLSRKRFVWDYWHVPNQYTYLRTFAQKYFPATLYGRFLRRLQSWGESNLGCGRITAPWLSYYVDGCRQELHTDTQQGPWAFVYSLTRWDRRQFDGGTTFFLRSAWPLAGPPDQTGQSLERDSLIYRVPPMFNQLTVFDSRIAHGVDVIEGTRDPLDSRLVLHGWFLEPTIVTDSGVPADRVRSIFDAKRPDLLARLSQLGRVAGLVVARLALTGHREVEILSNTLVSLSGSPQEPSQVTRAVLEFLQTVELPPEASPGWVILPISFPLDQR